jgi:hypothetical protein
MVVFIMVEKVDVIGIEDQFLISIEKPQGLHVSFYSRPSTREFIGDRYRKRAYFKQTVIAFVPELRHGGCSCDEKGVLPNKLTGRNH